MVNALQAQKSLRQWINQLVIVQSCQIFACNSIRASRSHLQKKYMLNKTLFGYFNFQQTPPPPQYMYCSDVYSRGSTWNVSKTLQIYYLHCNCLLKKKNSMFNKKVLQEKILKVFTQPRQVYWAAHWCIFTANLFGLLLSPFDLVT